MAVLAGAVDDRLVGPVGAGDVELVDARVVAEVAALDGVAVDDPDEPAPHEGREGSVVDRGEVGRHGMGLEDDHPVLDEELVDDVQRADRRHVPRAEDEADAAGVRCRVGGRHGGGNVGCRDARLHPDLGGHAEPGEPVHQVHRHDLGGDAPIWPRPHRAGDPRPPIAGDLAHGVAVEPEPPEVEVRSGDRLLGGHRIVRREALRARRELDPGRRGGHTGREELVQDRDALARRHRDPRRRRRTKLGDRGVERLASVGGGTGSRGTNGNGPAGRADRIAR